MRKSSGVALSGGIDPDVLGPSTLTIPVHAKLMAELRTLEFRLTPSGAMTIHHPGGGSDDYADALMFACWAYRTKARKSRVRVILRAGPRWR